MSMKTRMIKQMADTIKGHLLKPIVCPHCDSGFLSQNDYISHTAVHPAEIIPNLYLGVRSNALNLDLVDRLGITHVVTISSASRRTLYSANSYLDPMHFVATHRVHVLSDRPTTSYFDAFHVFIDSVLKHQNDSETEDTFKVLVVCPSGKSLSPCFVAAYLLSRFDISLMATYNLLRDKRPNINLSKYMTLLRRYDDAQSLQIKGPLKRSLTFDESETAKVGKIKIVSGNDANHEERELLITKRTITMKSTVSGSKSQHLTPKKTLKHSHSTGYIELDSHIEFSHI